MKNEGKQFCPSWAWALSGNECARVPSGRRGSGDHFLRIPVPEPSSSRLFLPALLSVGSGNEYRVQFRKKTVSLKCVWCVYQSQQLENSTCKSYGTFGPDDLPGPSCYQTSNHLPWNYTAPTRTKTRAALAPGRTPDFACSFTLKSRGRGKAIFKYILNSWTLSLDHLGQGKNDLAWEGRRKGRKEEAGTDGMRKGEKGRREVSCSSNLERRSVDWGKRQDNEDIVGRASSGYWICPFYTPSQSGGQKTFFLNHDTKNKQEWLFP